MLITGRHDERHRDLRKQRRAPRARKILGDVEAQTIRRGAQRIRPDEISEPAIGVRRPGTDGASDPRLQLVRASRERPTPGRPSDVSRTCVLSVFMRFP